MGVLALMEVFRPSHGTVRFGDFELDQDAGELRRGGVKVRLQEQPLQMLQILLEQPGKVVAREELQKRIWSSDTFVDFDHGINNAIKRLREALADIAETPRYIETLPRRGYRFIADTDVPVQATVGRIQFLAVLPLENLSRDPEQEYFTDGLTEALITSLAKISALRVISRTTAMHYKGVHRPLPEIARELGVDGIVEGTVMRSGERVRISAQLVRGFTDTHVWAESYDRDLRDILELQAEVARAIAREIQAKLAPQEGQQLAGTQVVNTEAYEAYLKARYYWNKLTPEGVRKAIEYFQQAIAKDASYAAAYTGLADCSSRLGWWGFVPPDRGFGAAKAAAQRAVELDPELAEAHGSLAWAITNYDCDCIKAEQEFRRALELNPNYASVTHFYAACLGAMGRWQESIAEIKRVLHLDPLSLIVNMTAAVILVHARRFEESMQFSRKGLELDPNFPSLRWALGIAYEGLGLYEQAVAEVEKAIQLSDGQAVYISALGHIHANAGRKDDALKIISQLQELSKERYIMPDWMAYIFSCLNANDEAFRYLEAAYAEHSAWLVYLKQFFWLDNLRSDPRFGSLLRRMNFPDHVERATRGSGSVVSS